MKVQAEEREQMRSDYVGLRMNGKTKTQARLELSDKYDRGRTTIFDNTYDLDDPQPLVDLTPVQVGHRKTFIATGWDIRVKPNAKFIACLQQMAGLYDAELLLVPMNRGDARYIPQELKDRFHVVQEDVAFNSNLQLKLVDSNALTQSPLTGFKGAYPDHTTILPGLVRELQTEPSHHYVKQLMTTGSVGYLEAVSEDYALDSDRDLSKRWSMVKTRQYARPTSIAQNYVIPSAVIIEVLDDDIFLTRFVASNRDGVVYDLNKRFTPTGYENSQPLALNVGDTHAAQANMAAVNCTIEMIRELNPKEVILNDFFDGISVNHHEINDAAKFFGVPSLEEEAEITFELLQAISEEANKITYIQSNHDNFLNSWLSGPSQYWRLNRNYAIACKLQSYRLETGNHPIISLLNLDTFKNLQFVTEHENHYVGRVLVKHGHEGISGSRSSFLGMAKVYNYYTQGHSHQPGVFRNGVCVGTTAELEQGYAIGASAWLHANAVIQPDNTIQLLPIINGVWRS